LFVIAAVGACVADEKDANTATNGMLDINSDHVVGLVEQAMSSARNSGGKEAPCSYIKKTPDGGALKWLTTVDRWSIRSAELFGVPKALVVYLLTERANVGRVMTVRIVFRDEKCEGFEAAFLAVD
jgi:hypothetical protein